jgi:PAS domain S-box-containing protein
MTTATGQESHPKTALEQNVANRFGVLPNFFLLSSSDPKITENLWAFAQFAYLDNAMPSLFKERLFVYLSKFCRIRYCLARHLGFLVGLGQPAGDQNCPPQTIQAVLPLLRRNVPHGEELLPFLKLCAESSNDRHVFPDPDSPEETAVIACATHIFLQTAEAPQAREALAHWFEPRDLEHLNLFLAFIRTAHYWTKLHPELTFESDITELLATHESLAECVFNDTAASEDPGNARLPDEISTLVEMRKLQGHLSAIVESSDDAIISEDLNGIIRSWNRGAEKLFGYSAAEMIGQPISLLAGANNTDDMSAVLNRVGRGERVIHYETDQMTKDGRVLTVSLSVSPVNDAAGRVSAAAIVARDITERKQLSDLKARLAAIVESSEDAIVSKDLTGKIQSWNKGAEQLFGYTADEAIGRPITIVIPTDRMHEEVDILSRLRRGERVEHFDTIRQHKDGSLLNISLKISPVKDAQGRVVGASKVARNITERKHQERVIQKTNKALRQSNEDLEQFAYSASHDLQEPLRTASAFSELLQAKFSGKLGAEGDKFIRYIADATTRMQELLRDLRTFAQASRVSQDQAPNIDAGEVLRRSISNMKAAIDDSNAVVTHSELPVVAIHEFQLEQLFQNVISNAIRYRSQASPTIHVDAKCSDRMCTFSARDNGIGIDPQYKEQIFGIFERLHTTADYPGTGMGLAICKRIVERLGGRIWVESEPGRGSTFYFTLPTPRQSSGSSVG